MALKNIKTPFGLKDGKLIHISDVLVSGKKCACICPACGEMLEARRFLKDPELYVNNHSDYFAHKNNTSCEYGTESALHYFAKEMIEESRKIVLPAITRDFPYFPSQEIIPEILLEIDSVLLEKNIENIKPDVIVEKNEQKLLIEIAVTHFIDNEKKEKIKKIGISTLEIDLSQYDLNRLTKKELKQLIVENPANKKWIYNSKEELYIEKKRQELQDEIDKKEKEKKKNIEISRNREIFYKKYEMPIERRSSKGAWNGKKDLWHVQNCPLKKRIYAEKYFANVYVDCFKCNYYRRPIEYRDKIICLHDYFVNKKNK